MKLEYRSTLCGLTSLFLLGLVLRVGLVLVLSQSHGERLTYEHGEIAQNLLAGRGFSVWFLGTSGPTSQQAPVYPLLLAGMFRIFGIESPAAILALQLLQCVAGSLVPVCVSWLAWSIFPQGRTIGWLAGCGALVYPPHVYMVTHIQVVPWATLCLVLLTALVMSPAWNERRGGAIVAGLLGGVLLLFEPILALALPILGLAWLLNVQSHRGWRAGIASSITMAAMSLVVISPWLVRNRCVHGEWVFVKSSFGYAFWQGNNAISWGTDKVPKPGALEMLVDHDGSIAGREQAMWRARHETIYIDDLLLKPTKYREFVRLSEPERSRALGRRAETFVREHPQEYARLCLQRLRYFFFWDETNPKTANAVYRIGTCAWLALTTLGLVVTLSHWRRWSPLLAICLSVAGFHALTIVSARFRIPLEPLTFVWCGAAAHWLCCGLASLGKPNRSIVDDHNSQDLTRDQFVILLDEQFGKHAVDMSRQVDRHATKAHL